MRWGELTTQLPTLDKLIEVLAYWSQAFSYYLLGMFTGLAELIRLILFGFLIRSLAGVAREYRAGEQAKLGLFAVGAATVIGLLAVLLLGVIRESYLSDLKKMSRESFTAPAPSFNPGANHQEFARQQQEYQRRLSAEFERLQEQMKSGQRGQKNWGVAGELLVFGLHAGALVLPALAAYRIHSASGRRRRA